MSDFNLKLSGIIIKKGDRFNSYCLDLDIQSEGDSIDEARTNLINAVSSLQAKGPLSELPASFPDTSESFSYNGYKSIVEEFYFEQDLDILGAPVLDNEKPNFTDKGQVFFPKK